MGSLLESQSRLAIITAGVSKENTCRGTLLLPDQKDFTHRLPKDTIMAVRKCTEADADAVAGVCVRGALAVHQMTINFPRLHTNMHPTLQHAQMTLY
jgi:hypothetical protein